MSQESTKKTAKKEAMKKLRESRKHIIKATSTRVKENRKAIKAIKEHLQAEARTVPEIAEATGLASSEVLWFIATLKKYGEILEGDKDGGYFCYYLAEAASE
ncbi:MAG: winged helix-turn-helix domain-containing protein [Deltaproteobacteria bacterium]|nr:MAG: winged helix-turn-helix domain-containing protein [Deltaproteobacteria bacterium]